ncbi:hypothetical protein D1007_16751 [Hordeum vulgare]|nr:hypothetical protein D1007_16751 [Hordeum vulgare]
MPISEIVSPKVYDIDDACVLYPAHSGERAECSAPILSVYAQDSIRDYIFTQKSCNVRKGKDIASVNELDGFLNEFADSMPVVQEVHMEEEELFMEKEVTNADSSEDDDDSSDADYDTGKDVVGEEENKDVVPHQKIKYLKRKREFEGDSEPEDFTTFYTKGCTNTCSKGCTITCNISYSKGYKQNYDLHWKFLWECKVFIFSSKAYLSIKWGWFFNSSKQKNQ